MPSLYLKSFDLAFFKIVETDINFVSSNGSDISQDFLLISMDFAATAQEEPPEEPPGTKF